MCVTCQQTKGLTPTSFTYQLVEDDSQTDSKLTSCKIDFGKLNAWFVGYRHHPTYQEEADTVVSKLATRFREVCQTTWMNPAPISLQEAQGWPPQIVPKLQKFENW